MYNNNQKNGQRNNQNRNNNGGNNNRGGYAKGQGQSQGRSNSQQNDTTFFNLHTIAMGYLNRVEMIPGNNGDFMVLNFGALEGPSNNTETKYINLTVPAKAALEIINSFWDDINDPNVKVFASIRIAGLTATAFEFGPQSKTPGVLGVNYTGKLINMLSLKVGNDTIDLGNDDSNHATNNQGAQQEFDDGYVPPQAPRNAQPQQRQPAPRQQGAPHQVAQQQRGYQQRGH